mmetsp:Transcript_15005/g.31860  ORF Transcript_15005/g.31860 Transcript_15005/m.31860 type:complete len:225 (+) Transcript_15005:2680-3354(+)
MQIQPSRIAVEHITHFSFRAAPPMRYLLPFFQCIPTRFHALLKHRRRKQVLFLKQPLLFGLLLVFGRWENGGGCSGGQHQKARRADGRDMDLAIAVCCGGRAVRALVALGAGCGARGGGCAAFSAGRRFFHVFSFRLFGASCVRVETALFLATSILLVLFCITIFVDNGGDYSCCCRRPFPTILSFRDRNSHGNLVVFAARFVAATVFYCHRGGCFVEFFFSRG